ncbi:MAG TPA: ABC transporter permease, partial [Thermoanaerobaculia bacterium]
MGTGTTILRSLWEDLRNAARSIARQPRIAVVSALVLGLGIGLATTVSSIASGLILRGLPFPDAERLVSVGGLDLRQPDRRLPVSLSDLRAWAEQQKTLESVAYFQSWFSYLTWPGGGTDVYVGSSVAPQLFSVLRVGAQYGRLPLAGDCKLGQSLVVLSDKVWLDRFGRSPSILGTTVRINRRPYTVVGVMPRGFAFPYRQDLWTLFCPDTATAADQAAPTVFAVARLRPGVSLAEANTELRSISERRAAAVASSEPPRRARVEPYLYSVTDPNLRRALLAVGGGAGLLLFVCCCTVALLLLLSTLRQQTSIAVRAALGSSLIRTSRESLVRTFLISAAGALVGLAVARGCIVLFNSLLAPSAYLRGFWVDIRLDAITFLAATAAAVVAVPLCGFLPALRAARTDPMTVLRRSSASGSLARVGWPGRILVMGQVALSFVLLAGAAVTTSAGLRLARYPYGFDPAGLFTAKLSLYAIHGIDDAKPDQQARLYLRVLERVRTVPGVRAASVTSALPTQVRAGQELVLPGEEGPAQWRTARWLSVSPGFTTTLGLPLLSGRDLSESDTAGSPPVALVNRSFVKRFLRVGSVIGSRIGLFVPGQEAPKWTTIVGVLGDSAMTVEGESEEPEALYVPLSQTSDLGGSFMYLLVRSTEPPAALSRAISREIRTVEPDLAMWEPESLTQVIRRSTWIPRAFIGLFGVFAFGATLLACSSLYSVVALDVRR